MLYFSHVQVVMQEVPDEISLAFSLSGCPLRCPGCHSAVTWKPTYGEPLSKETFDCWLSQYQGLASCVLFYGGEWELSSLMPLVQQARTLGYKVALYSGCTLDELDARLIAALDYLKVGRWQADRGGLEHTGTNQRFYAVTPKDQGVSLDNLTYRFWK